MKTLKNSFWVSLIVVFVYAPTNFVYAQQDPMSQDTIYAKEAWAEIAKEKFLADYFGQFFNRIGIEIAETGERITVQHMGDHMEMTDGFNADSVDFVLFLKIENIKKMLSHAKDGKISEDEAYRMTSVMFTPMTTQTLQNPVLTDNLPKFFAKLESVTHVTLYNSDGTQTVSHTLIYVNDEWIVVPGLQGTPQRVYKMNVEQSLLYHQKVMEAIKANDKQTWKEFKRWYMTWRETVSETVA